LIFPHHEAEIAQMEAVSGKSPLVKYWIHIGFLNTGGTKMSKSLSNFLTIRDVLKNYNFRVLRLFYLSGHYRSSIEFSEDILEQTKNSLKRGDEFVFNINPTLELSEEKEATDKLREKVINALDDDFNTPKALALLFNFIKERNTKGMVGMYTLNYIKEINKFLGFFEFNDYSDKEIDNLVKQRDVYRKAKEFQKADEIKQTLLQKGVQLYDSEDGTKWRKITI